MERWLVACGVLALGAACGPQTLEITMAEDNSSGQNGTATIIDRGDTFTITIDIAPHAVETEPQLVHIHPGRCRSIGDPILALNRVVDGHSETTLEPLNDDQRFEVYRRADHALNVHLASNPSTYVSCGNIPRL